jgi:hypothetical protein
MAQLDDWGSDIRRPGCNERINLFSIGSSAVNTPAASYAHLEGSSGYAGKIDD